MKKIKTIHHTVADWDFETGTTKILDTAVYVSPPSSLKLGYGGAPPIYCTILCRIAATLCIAQGEVRTWVKADNINNPQFIYFRNQAALGSANPTNTYRWRKQVAGVWLYRIINDDETLIDTFNLVGNDTYGWNHIRIIYWNGKNLEGQDALCNEFYLELAGEWVKQGETLYDTANQWAASEVNRSGIGAQNNGWYQRFDDTEIWGAI